MIKNKLIKKLYEEMLNSYEEPSLKEDIKNIPIDEMEDALLQYYNAAGFDLKNIDELINFITGSRTKEEIQQIENSILESLNKSGFDFKNIDEVFNYVAETYGSNNTEINKGLEIGDLF